jgi:hypothetical protein
MVIALIAAAFALAFAADWFNRGSGPPPSWREGPATLRGRFVYLGFTLVAGGALVVVMRLVRGHWG